MTRDKEKAERLRLILGRAHARGRENRPGPGPNWRKGLMNSLPPLPSRPFRTDPWDIPARLVWRLVPAAGALALIMAVLLTQINPEPNLELASLVSGDSANSSLYTFYQGE